MSTEAIARPGLIVPESGTKGYEGAGIFESACGLVDGINQGDWFGAGGNLLATGLSLIGAVMDPLQAIFAAGVGWLMDHVSFLREPLDKLMGDPKAIEGHARSWYNIEQRIYNATDFFIDEVKRTTDAWAAQSAEAYRQVASQHAESVQALGKIADGMSKATTVVGAMIGVARNTLRDIIAEVVGACISKALQAVTVVLIPKVAAEVAILMSATSAKILGVLRQLFASLREMGRFTTLLGGLLERIGQANRNVLRLEAFRIEAAATSGAGLAGIGNAHGLLSQGHEAVHGVITAVVVETARSASQTNSTQNTGSTGSTLTGAKSCSRPPRSAALTGDAIMDPLDDRIAKRLAEIKAQEAQLDRAEIERAATVADSASAVVDRRKGGALRSGAFLVGILALAAGLLGLAVTLSRLAGDDIRGAERLGHATASSCTRQGPITNKGFGFWDSCTATITWDDGQVERFQYGVVLTSADIGTQVRVGDLGTGRAGRQLVRDDATYRPWLRWIGYLVGIIALVPGLIGALIVSELLRFRRR